jgi:predicted RNA-binding protein with PUA-like domain
VSYWLIKSEPSAYSWSKLAKEGRVRWDGVRNFMARNNLRAMKEGDLALYYHSNVGKEIVGVARVVREAYADPTAPKGEDWSAVDFAPAFPLAEPVTLAAIKATNALADMQLLRQSRISVVPVTKAEFDIVLKMSHTKRPN